jgi:hypothetical protein
METGSNLVGVRERMVCSLDEGFCMVACNAIRLAAVTIFSSFIAISRGAARTDSGYTERHVADSSTGYSTGSHVEKNVQKYLSWHKGQVNSKHEVILLCCRYYVGKTVLLTVRHSVSV